MALNFFQIFVFRPGIVAIYTAEARSVSTSLQRQTWPLPNWCLPQFIKGHSEAWLSDNRDTWSPLNNLSRTRPSHLLIIETGITL